MMGRKYLADTIAVSADKKRREKSKGLCRGGKEHDVHLVTNDGTGLYDAQCVTHTNTTCH